MREISRGVPDLGLFWDESEFNVRHHHALVDKDGRVRSLHSS